MNYEVVMKKQAGFTLIELVIVVVILSFLAVTAIPKFIDLTGQAKQANVEGMAGGFATAISLARAQWEAEGRPHDSSTPANNFVSYDGTSLALTREDTSNSIRPGYVLGLAALGSTIGDVDCVAVWNNILQQPPNITSTFANLNSDSSLDYYASKQASTTNPTCHYYYKETLSVDSSGDFVDPATSTAVGNSFTYQPASSTIIVHINDN